MAEAGMVAFGSTAPSDDSTERAKQPVFLVLVLSLYPLEEDGTDSTSEISHADLILIEV